MTLFRFVPSASFAALEAVTCRSVEILNNSGALLEIRFAADTATDHVLELKDGQSVLLNVEMTSAEIEVKGAGTDKVSLIMS